MPHILLVKTSSMGDVIHNLPVIADILTHLPNTTFDWLVEESFAQIPALHPQVKEVIPVAIRRWRRQLLRAATWQEMSVVKQRLQSKQYDAVIDTQGLIKSAIFTKLANGPTHGMDSKSAREPLASYFYQHRHYVPRNQHAVARNRALAAQALGYPIPATLPDYGLSRLSSPQAEIDKLALSNPYVVCLHATSRDSKLWHTENWIKLGNHLNKQGITMVFPWASPTEQARANLIAAQLAHAQVLPKLGLATLAVIIKNAIAAVGVDTGLIHLATALATPSVAIYTDTDPNLTGIYPGASAMAFNVGGQHQPPSVDDVIGRIHALDLGLSSTITKLTTA